MWIGKTILEPTFTWLSVEARVTYYSLYLGAGMCDAGGLLLSNGTPLTVREIELWTRLGLKKQKLALTELQVKGFIQITGSGAIEVLNWAKLQETKDAARKRLATHGNSAESPPDNIVDSAENAAEIPHQKYRDTPRDINSLRSLNPSGPAAEEKKPEAEWVKPLRDEVRPMVDRPWKTLGLAERLRLGEYTAFRFANFTKDQSANRREGKKFASAIMAMSQQQRLSDLTVKQFLQAAQRFWEATNREPIRNLWHVQAALESAE